MMNSRQASDLLGVSLDATPVQIQSAYRAKARQWHPDICDAPDAADRMATLTLAYRMLTTNTVVDASVRETFGDLFGSGLDDLKI
jgi:curved DNA-binding protein CbpA